MTYFCAVDNCVAIDILDVLVFVSKLVDTLMD
jgi:hypothetical protein